VVLDSAGPAHPPEGSSSKPLRSATILRECGKGGGGRERRAKLKLFYALPFLLVGGEGRRKTIIPLRPPPLLFFVFPSIRGAEFGAVSFFSFPVPRR